MKRPKSKTFSSFSGPHPGRNRRPSYGGTKLNGGPAVEGLVKSMRAGSKRYNEAAALHGPQFP